MDKKLLMEFVDHLNSEPVRHKVFFQAIHGQHESFLQSELAYFMKAKKGLRIQTEAFNRVDVIAIDDQNKQIDFIELKSLLAGKNGWGDLNKKLIDNLLQLFITWDKFNQLKQPQKAAVYTNLVVMVEFPWLNNSVCNSIKDNYGASNSGPFDKSGLFANYQIKNTHPKLVQWFNQRVVSLLPLVNHQNGEYVNLYFWIEEVVFDPKDLKQTLDNIKSLLDKWGIEESHWSELYKAPKIKVVFHKEIDTKLKQELSPFGGEFSNNNKTFTYPIGSYEAVKNKLQENSVSFLSEIEEASELDDEE